MCINTDRKEELCFGEEITEVTSLTSLAVNVTRSGPACREHFDLCLIYFPNGMFSRGKYMQSSFHSAT